MSWNIYSIPVPADGRSVAESAKALLSAAERGQGGYADLENPAVVAQIEAAGAAVEGLIASGAVGKGPFTANLSGHANPEHKPLTGWANDTITVSLTHSS